MVGGTGVNTLIAIDPFTGLVTIVVGDTQTVDIEGLGFTNSLAGNGQLLATTGSTGGGHLLLIDLATGTVTDLGPIDAPGVVGNGDYESIDCVNLTLPATVGSTVWFDANNDGIQDPGETGVAGVTVNLLDANGNIVATAVTDANGDYEFTVPPGTYQVEFDQTTFPPGFVLTTPDAGADDSVDSDADPATGTTITFTLGPGENDPSWDAGIFQPDPEIDIEKSTNTVDADVAPGVLVASGGAVTWTCLLYTSPSPRDS